MIRLSKFYLALLALYSYLAAALSIPSGSSPTTQDSSILTLSQPLNFSNLNNPTPPPGLYCPIFWDPEDYEFEPQELWMSLVTFQSDLARYPQNDRVPPNARSSSTPISGAKIIIIPLSQNSFGRIVWALWDIGRQMATRYPMPELVPTLSTRVHFADGLAGYISLKKPPERDSKGAAANTTTAEGTATNATTATARRRRLNAVQPLHVVSGRTTAREDPNLVISYSFLNRPLVPGEILTAFLMANVIVSQHEETQLGASISAYSIDDRVRLILDDVVPGHGPGANQLTWRLARIGLRTLWQNVIMGFKYNPGQFVDGPRWQSVRFDLEYRGVKIGQGWLG
ncbi:MAG: hypothetical protein Q9222_004344 [Ikaeria aurantiellina]